MCEDLEVVEPQGQDNPEPLRQGEPIIRNGQNLLRFDKAQRGRQASLPLHEFMFSVENVRGQGDGPDGGIAVDVTSI